MPGEGPDNRGRYYHPVTREPISKSEYDRIRNPTIDRLMKFVRHQQRRPAMATRAEVYAALNSERDYQDMRKSRDSGAHTHSVEEFILFMEDYLHEARNVASRTWGPTAREKTLEIVRKVTALGVACMEDNGAPQRAGFEHDAASRPREAGSA